MQIQSERGMGLVPVFIIVLALAGLGGFWALSGGTGKSEQEMGKADTMMEKEDGAMTEKKDATTMEEKNNEMVGEDATGAMMNKNDGAMMEKKDEGTMVQKGSYEAYGPEKIARAMSGKVVLFFRASWCPTCRGLDADIKGNAAQIPNGVTVLDVNYDASQELKMKYGVTYQHTLVQVDAAGNQITKWTGSPTLAALLGQIK